MNVVELRPKDYKKAWEDLNCLIRSRAEYFFFGTGDYRHCSPPVNMFLEEPDKYVRIEKARACLMVLDDVLGLMEALEKK